MIPYKWEETEDFHLAIIKPKELFVEGSISENLRHRFEIDFAGILKETGEESLYALGYSKERFDRQLAEKYASWIDDIFSWNPEEETNAVEKQERKAA